MANLNLNKVILGGRITADPELKQTPQGVSVVTFSIAINRKGAKETTDFINCVAWRSTAEFISKYFQKGSSIVLDGSIQVRSYQDKEDNKRQAVEVVINDAYFVDSKGNVEGSTVAFNTANEPKFEEIADEDDDLPF
jgi:single-strand DNA-binding protein